MLASDLLIATAGMRCRQFVIIRRCEDVILSFQILGIGTALPEHTMSQDEAVAMSTDLICRDQRESRLLRTMLRRSQVSNRHTCVPHRTAYGWVDEDCEPSGSPGPSTQQRMLLYAEHAGPLAATAAQRALDEADVSVSDISHLITVSCTGFEAPGVDVHLIEQLGLPRTTERTHIGFMGCHGAINGLRVAAALGNSNPSARTLLCATELCSLHYRVQWDDERILGNALFADGSAALVGCQLSNGHHRVCQLKATGSYLVPESSETITWHVGDHGFEMTLSNRVPELIRQHLRPWLSQWLDSLGVPLSAIGAWAVHPGGPRILDAVEEALGLDELALSVSRGVLKDHGNMSSPTILFILKRMLSAAMPRPCVALGFGPGLMIEAALLD